MVSDGYPFIDIAVLDAVRSRFAAGDTLIVLNSVLDNVLWANGQGAVLMGHDSLQDCIGFPPAFGIPALRQIRATRGFPAIAADQGLLLRVAQGLSSTTIAFTASGLSLPGGEMAVLLASQPIGKSIETKDLLAGLVQAGSEAALIGEMGEIIAASPGFTALGLADQTLSDLARDVRGENDRLIKRMAPVPAGLMPVGIGRIADAPQMNLLIAVTDPSAIVAARPEPALPEASADASDDLEPAKPFGRRQSFDPGTRAGVDRWYFHGSEDSPGDRLTREILPDSAKTPAGRPVSENKAASNANPLPVDPDASPVRFIWRTDAEGRFSAVSNEFSAAVGAPAANIIGRTFEEVARVFGLDEDGEIAALLARRDTWSGRCVMWPVTGTELKAPVDLAALPAYSRDRIFEGFKGFGVLRMGDAVRDPERIGMALVGGGKLAETAGETGVAATVDASANDPFQGEVPALAPSATPDRRDADKVIRLAEHRPPVQPAAPAAGLSNIEQSAFREIADRLVKEGLARAEATHAADVELQRDTGDETGETDLSADVKAEHDDAAETPISSQVSDPEDRAEGKAENPDLAMLDRLPLPLLVHSGDVLHHANDEFLAITGYDSLDDLNAAGGIGALFAEDGENGGAMDENRRMLRLVTRSGAEKPVEAHLQSIPWGNSKALLLSLRPLPGTASEPVENHIAAGNPLADANRELELRVAELDTILDTATDGIVLIGMDGKIRSISRAAEALFGFDSGEVAGKPYFTLFAVESQRAARDYLSGLTENGVASVLNDGREVIGREAKGRFIPLFMTIGRLPGDSGFCAVLRDITQWKRAEEELGQARRLAEAASAQKTDFLARISHEIRTPLNAIIGFSELMLDEKFGPVANERYRDYLRDINRSGSHVLDLVNDLLDISKIEAGAQDMHFEAVSLNEALSGAVSMMQPLANRERVIIRSSLASGLPEVVADLRSIKQIALNLLSNAVRFTNAGGQVIVSTSYEMSGDVIMRVRDTGIGMSRPEIELALKPFRQVSAVKSGRSDGTGLGLPLTKAMVEANRAKFLIHSTPGEGTMIEIAFPSTRVLAE